MVERFSGKGGLFEDLAFDQPKVIDEGDPNNPLDDQYESGRIPALKAVQISAFTNYMDEAANVLHDPNYDSRMAMVNRVLISGPNLFKRLLMRMLTGIPQLRGIWIKQIRIRERS